MSGNGAHSARHVRLGARATAIDGRVRAGRDRGNCRRHERGRRKASRVEALVMVKSDYPTPAARADEASGESLARTARVVNGTATRRNQVVARWRPDWDDRLTELATGDANKTAET